MSEASQFTRRTAVAGIVASATLLATACSRSEEKRESRQPTEPPAARATQARAMTMHRDPGCGCCEAWAKIAMDAGFQVAVVDEPNMPAVKQRYAVPEELASCHTATVNGYVIEGHVPMDDIRRLLRERPKGVTGLAVPGMPRGSPGMEMPDGAKDDFKVIAFAQDGLTSVFSG